MKILKKSLSLCLMLSIICTSLVFTGAGTVFAAAPIELVLDKKDTVAVANPAADDTIWVEFDITQATINGGQSRIEVNTGNNYTCRLIVYYGNTYSNEASRGILRLQKNNSTGGNIDLGKITKPCHVTVKHTLRGATAERTTVYINGVQIHYHGATSTNNSVLPVLDNGKINYLTTLSGSLFGTVKGKYFVNDNTDQTAYFANFEVKEGVDDVVVSDGTYAGDDQTIICPENMSMTAADFVAQKLNYSEGASLTIERGLDTITSLSDAGLVQDGDVFVLTSGTGNFIHKYTIKIPVPVRLNLSPSINWDEFDGVITAEVSEDVAIDSAAVPELYINSDGNTEPIYGELTGRNIRFENVSLPLGKNELIVSITDLYGKPWTATKNTTVTLSNPITLSLNSVIKYNELETITAKLSPYFEESKISDARLYVNGVVDETAGWDVTDDNTLVFSGFNRWLGDMDIRVEFDYVGESDPLSSETVSVSVQNHEFTPATNFLHDKLYFNDGSANKGTYVEHKYAGSYSELTGLDYTGSFTLTPSLIANPRSGDDVTLYKFTLPFKLDGNTGFTLDTAFEDKTTKALSTYKNLITVSRSADGTTYEATIYDAKETTRVFAEGLAADTLYNLEVIINKETCTADYKLTSGDGTGYLAEFVSLPDFVASQVLNRFRVKFSIPKKEGPVTVGDAKIYYGINVQYVKDSTVNSSADNNLNLALPAEPVLAEGKELKDYITVTDADGNIVDFYDAEILNNEIKIYSNDIVRGGTYNVVASPELALKSETGEADEIGAEFRTTIDVPFADLDVTDFNCVRDGASTAKVTTILQNQNNSDSELITVIARVTDSTGKITKGIYLKTITVSGNADGDSDVFDGIPCEAGQKVEVFYATGGSDFNALSNNKQLFDIN